MSFTFLLNSQPVEEPMGWREADLKIIRDAALPGLFTEVIADLEFYGEGYSLLKSLYDGSNGCVEASVEISNDCGFLFNGIIYLSNVEFDLKRCIASCSVEDNTAGSIISRLKSVDVQINGGVSLDGSAIANIGETLAAGGTVGNKTWFKAGDLLQYCLDYFSNSSIQIVSDFLFTNPYRPRRLQVTVTALGPSGLFRPTWADIYGQTKGPITGAIAGGLTSIQLATRMSQILNGQSQLFGGGANEANGIWPIYADNNGTNTIEILFFGNQTISFGATFPWGALSVSELETASYGASNVYLTTGAIIKDEIDAFFVSFENIFNGIAGWYNLSVEPYFSAGQNYLRIEQEPYFFQQSQIAEVNNYESITQQKQDIYNFSSLNYGRTSSDENAFLHQEISYVGQSCSTKQIDLNSQIQVPTSDFPTDPSQYASKDIIIAEKWTPSPGVNAVRSYLVSYFDGTSIQSGEYWAASISHPFVAKNYSNRAPDGLTLQGINIPNINNPKLKSVVAFNAGINLSQLSSIRANLKGYILFDGTKGWIKEISTNLTTGLTSFQLITE
jgi:hypothetical protein